MYLTVAGCTQPEQLKARIRILGEGTAIKNYTWESKPVRSSVPTDAQILIHLFCTYMDLSLMWLNPNDLYNPKPFTQRHMIIRGQSKLSEKGDLDIVIYEAHVSRPHFEIVLRAKNEKTRDDSEDDSDDDSQSSDSEDDLKEKAPASSGIDFSKIPQYHSAASRSRGMGVEEVPITLNEMEYVTWACLHGRHNLFQALVLFIFFIKKYRGGYLGDVNLRRAINLLQIIEDE